MPTWDKKTKSYKGRIRIKGHQQRTKTGFIDKQSARHWEKELKRAILTGENDLKLLLTSNKNTYGRVELSKINPYLFEMKAKYETFLKSPYNTLPDLIDMMFTDFQLPYSYKHIKEIASNRVRPKLAANLRMEILKRDNFKCVLCGATADDCKLHIDHIVAIDRGGVTEERNLRTLCERCNYGKRDFPFYVTG